MLHLPVSHLYSTGTSYAQLANEYLRPTDTQPTITNEQQQAFLLLLDNELHKERFYIITDVKTGAIVRCNGINTWLGYTNVHFTQKDYVSIMHPAHAVVEGFYVTALFELFSTNQLYPAFMQPVCTTTLALKTRQHQYLYCKRQCYPFQLNADNRMTAYICEFMIVKNYVNEDYSTILNNNKGECKSRNELLKKIVQEKFEATACFSVQELRILKRYAKDGDSTSDSISKAFKIEKSTVDTFNKRILKKTEQSFNQRCSNAKIAAAYFKRMQLI